MKTLHDLFTFYATNTCFKIVGAMIFSHIQTVFLVISIVNNIKLTRSEVDDRRAYRRYQLHRVPYILGFLLCTTLTGFMTDPAMDVDFAMRTSFWYDVVMMVTYLCAAFCLYQLEAGLAMFMHLYLCLPIMCLGLKYCPDAASGLAIGCMFDGGLICLIIWELKGSRVAKKYLGIRTAWDLDDRKLSDDTKVLTPGRS